MWQQRSIFRQPGPVDAVENQIGELRNVGMAEVLATTKHSAQQNGCIHGRNFRIPNPFAGVDIGEVVEESTVLRQLFPQESKGGENAFQRSFTGDEATLVTDAECGEAEPGCRDAGHDSLVIHVQVATIFHHAGFRAGLLPEVEEVSTLQIIQKLVVFG